MGASEVGGKARICPPPTWNFGKIKICIIKNLPNINKRFSNYF
jgi:hypothetical protein